MRILLVGAGGVGSAFTAIAARRDFFELCVVADYDEGRARKAVDALAVERPEDKRFASAAVDASSRESVTALCREHAITHVMNAVDPRFVISIFEGAYAAGADYLDMAMSLSHPHPENPYSEVGIKLGDEQFAVADEWEREGRLASRLVASRSGPARKYYRPTAAGLRALDEGALGWRSLVAVVDRLLDPAAPHPSPKGA